MMAVIALVILIKMFELVAETACLQERKSLSITLMPANW
jgi:hypothetical protein